MTEDNADRLVTALKALIREQIEDHGKYADDDWSLEGAHLAEVLKELLPEKANP